MATDMEARSTGGSAMLIALVTLVMVVIGAFAYFNGGRTEIVPAVGTTTVINQPPSSAPAQAPDVNVIVSPVIVDKSSPGSESSPGGSTKDAAKNGS